MVHLSQQQHGVALVTGASSGFGAITARRLHTLGFRVFGTSRRGLCPGDAPGVEMLALDVDCGRSVAACVDRVLARTSRIDVVVNNAGRAMIGACEETTAEEARALFETNLFGVMRMVAAVLPAMRLQKGGTIINVGSASGFVGVPFHGVYAASKHALAGYSEALRVEVEPFGVSVYLVEPSAHRTAIQMSRPGQRLPQYDGPRESVEAVIRAQIETGADPERVARVIAEAAVGSSSPWRVRVGSKAVLAAWTRRLLPAGLFDRFLRQQFRLASKS